MKFITILLAIFISSQAIADCSTMHPFGKPVVKTTETVTYLCRRMYAIEHSPSRHTAYWSAEKLLGENMNVAAVRVNAFRMDPDLPPGESAKTTDYDNSKWDQGHLAPVGDMHVDKAAMLESFYLSNMVPQHPQNNRIGWKTLEDMVRSLAVSRKELFVVTGPIYLGKPKTIGSTGVAIPTHMYKIVYDPATNESMSFVAMNTPFYVKDIPASLTSLATVEKMTKIKFFPSASTPVIDAKQIWIN